MGDKKKTELRKLLRGMKVNWQIYAIAAIPIIYTLIMNYGPMYGVQISFRDYRPAGGITGSNWVGLQWIEKFLTNYEFQDIFYNTVVLSLYDLVVSFPLPIIFALILNAVRSEKLKKTVQTITYMPHFISLAVMISILDMVFSPVSGMYGNLYRLFGGVGYPSDFRASADSFRHLYVWSGVWKGLGWDAIIYIAALSAVSAELHEAAQLDRATRFQRIIHIDIPAIMPTIVIKLLLNCSGIISVGFEKVFLMQKNLNLRTSEVISTYVYKTSIGSFRDFSYGAAVGLFNTVINLSLLLSINYVCKKATDNELSLF